MQKSRVYSEVYSILNLLGKEYIEKLPSKLYDMIQKNRDISYSPKYDISTNINEQNISKQALSMITLFNLKCWSTEEEREEIRKILNENEKVYQKNAKKMYDLSFLSEQKSNGNENAEIKTIVVNKENLFTKFLNKLKNFFKRK